MTTDQQAATYFITSYLKAVDHELSIFPSIDRHLFPKFTRAPQRVLIHVGADGGLAFHAKRPARRLSVSVGMTHSEVDAAAGLPTGTRPMFIFQGNGPSDPRFAPNTFENLRFQLRMPGAQDPFADLGSTLRGDNMDSVFRLGVRTELRLIDVVVARPEGRRVQRDLFPLLWVMKGLSESFLDETRAQRIATIDAAGWILGIAFDPLGKTFSETTLNILKGRVESLREEYSRLIGLTNTEEEEVQSFLRDHPGLLDPSGRVTPKRPFGSLVSDFLIEYSDGSYRLVEIERPHDSVLLSDRFSQRATGALEQVKSWVGWLGTNTDPLNSKRARSHWVIIGLRSRQSKEQLDLLAEESVKHPGIEVRFFDDLMTNLDAPLERLLWRGKRLREQR